MQEWITAAAESYGQKVHAADSRAAEQGRTAADIAEHGPALWQALLAELTDLVNQFNTATDPEHPTMTLTALAAVESGATAYSLACPAGAGAERKCRIAFDGRALTWDVPNQKHQYTGEAEIVSPTEGDVRFSQDGKFISVQAFAEAILKTLLETV